MDVIRLAGLRVNCVVGVYPEERHTPQPLIVDVDLHVRTEEAGQNERLSSTVDYAATAGQLAFLLTSCRFRLLETAAHALARFLLLPAAPGERRPTVSSVQLCLTKPSALGGEAVPSLRVRRDAKWPTYTREQARFGTVDVVHETRDAGIYRLNIAPGQEIPLHRHEKMRESEMVLGSGLLCQDAPVKAGTVHRWPLSTPHRYLNPTAQYQSILCVDSPPFIEADEIPTDGMPVPVRPEPAFVGWSR